MALLRLALSCSIVFVAACTRDPKPRVSEPTKVTSGGDTSLPTSQLQSEELTYEVDGVKLRGYLAYDSIKHEPRPGVLIVHEWWGHNDYVRRRANMLAELGYTAFALDMYGDGKLAEHPDDAKKFMLEASSNMATAEKRFEAARALLAQHETTTPDQIAAIGYCFGGGVVLHMARAGAPLAGVASFHGTLATESPAQAGNVKARLLVAHGAADPFIPSADVEAFKQEMEIAGVDLQFVAYEGAKHAFTVPAATDKGERTGLPLRYDPEADADSWRRLEAFLQEIFAE